MTSEAQLCDNVVTTLSDVATKIQPKPNLATTSRASWEPLIWFSTLQNTWNWNKLTANILGGKVCQRKWLIFGQNDFWISQILPVPWLKTDFIADGFIVIFVWANFLFAWFVFSSDTEAYSEPFQTYFKHKIELYWQKPSS